MAHWSPDDETIGRQGSRMLTLAEEFLLLALDDNGRKLVGGERLSAAVAGAAIVELALDGALRMTEPGEPGQKPGRLVVGGHQPKDPRLADLLQVAVGRKPKDAVSKVAGFGSWHSKAKDLQEALLQDLTAAGTLLEVSGKMLGVFPTIAWKPGNPDVKAAVLQRVQIAIGSTTTPDDRTAALISIAHAVDLLPKLCPAQDRRTVKRRGQEISESEWAGRAVRKAVQEIQAATVAVIVATTTVASTGSN